MKKCQVLLFFSVAGQNQAKSQVKEAFCCCVPVHACRDPAPCNLGYTSLLTQAQTPSVTEHTIEMAFSNLFRLEEPPLAAVWGSWLRHHSDTSPVSKELLFATIPWASWVFCPRSSSVQLQQPPGRTGTFCAPPEDGLWFVFLDVRVWGTWGVPKCLGFLFLIITFTISQTVRYVCLKHFFSLL